MLKTEGRSMLFGRSCSDAAGPPAAQFPPGPDDAELIREIDKLGEPPTRISLGRIADGVILCNDELAAVLRVHPRTLQRLVKRGEFLPPVLFGGRNLWDVGLVKAWFADAAKRKAKANARKRALRQRAVAGRQKGKTGKPPPTSKERGAARTKGK